MTLTKAQVYDRLRERAATRVEIPFSGGNDEGGADAIILYAGEEQIGDLPTWSEPGAADPDTELADALTAPIYARWNFDGEPYVDGTLTWDVTSETTTLTGEASTTQPFDEEL
jgi:hypothetical protein